MTKYEFTDCASQAGSTPASPTPSRCAPPCILDPAACISTPAGAKGVPCMRLLRLSSQSKVSERNPLPVGLVCPAARDLRPRLSNTHTRNTLCLLSRCTAARRASTTTCRRRPTTLRAWRSWSTWASYPATRPRPTSRRRPIASWSRRRYAILLHQQTLKRQRTKEVLRRPRPTSRRHPAASCSRLRCGNLLEGFI